jgi:hypothetical protein
MAPIYRRTVLKSILFCQIRPKLLFRIYISSRRSTPRLPICPGPHPSRTSQHMLGLSPHPGVSYLFQNRTRGSCACLCVPRLLSIAYDPQPKLSESGPALRKCEDVCEFKLESLDADAPAYLSREWRANQLMTKAWAILVGTYILLSPTAMVGIGEARFLWVSWLKSAGFCTLVSFPLSALMSSVETSLSQMTL